MHTVHATKFGADSSSFFSFKARTHRQTKSQTPLVTQTTPRLQPAGVDNSQQKQENLTLASMARDDPPASSTASSTVAAMRGKVGSEFET